MERIPEAPLNFLHSCTTSVCYPSVQIPTVQGGLVTGELTQSEDLEALANVRKTVFPFLSPQGCVSLWLVKQPMQFLTLPAHIAFM